MAKPNELDNVVLIYTDGSGIDGNIGAAAYSSTITAYRHLGTDQEYNVYTGELTAFLLALQILKQLRRSNTNNVIDECNIYSDSQATIKALMNPRKQSSQTIIKDILDEIDHLLLYGMTFSISWIPGHQEIQGNKKADEAAKKAAQDPTINNALQRGTWNYMHLPLKSAQKMKIKALAKDNWKEVWDKTKTAALLRHLSKGPKFQTGTKYYGSAPTRKSATTLVQMCTGHCGLNSYLNRFKKIPSAYCDCKYQKETVQHYLLECRRYKVERDTLRRIIGNERIKMEILLGKPTYIKHIAKYVEETKRFK